MHLYKNMHMYIINKSAHSVHGKLTTMKSE